ncbi:MAG: proline--tRNA ligase [Alphaproteobacteria bacterium]|nr:proline--tRNA ligase [Alphaproteobacteria bacterium]
MQTTKLCKGVRLTEFFMPTLRNAPSDAKIVSHQLMLRAGMIRQESSGIYSWLPLGYRILTKISEIISQEQNKIGACEMLMPTIQSADLWKKSGRYDDYGQEMLRINDRHNQEMLFGPTNEEMITDIFANFAQSYKDLPKNIFQIQWKFRDEIRPRFGVMRGREFLMKDGYGFAIDEEQHKKIYNKIFVSYLRTFARLGVKAIPMQADTGPIGGKLSHEFIILADTGESEIFCDKEVIDLDILQEKIDYRGDLEPIVNKWTEKYASTDEMFVEQEWAKVPDTNKIATRGIEVGHIFYFGTKYSEPLGLKVADKDGSLKPLHMGSYGIGVSRVFAGIIEACHDEKGIVFPSSVAPFDVGLVNVSLKDENCTKTCDEYYETLQNNDIEVAYDDRDIGAGAKFSDMELIGLPWVIVVGKKSIEKGLVELKNRTTGQTQDLSFEQAINIVKGK